MKLIQMPKRTSAVAAAGVSPEGAGPRGIDPQGVDLRGVLPQVYATDGNLALAVVAMHAEAGSAPVVEPAARPALRVVITPETAFYRKYTEAMLQRYSVMKLQKGRVPSLLGRELFRGKVTSYKVHGFDDMVIFVHDVEQCMRLLDTEQQRVVYRVAVQEYTFGETAAMLRWSLRSTQRRYHEAIDELTAIFQKRGLMDKAPGLKGTQLAPEVGVAVSYEEQQISQSAKQ